MAGLAAALASAVLLPSAFAGTTAPGAGLSAKRSVVWLTANSSAQNLAVIDRALALLDLGGRRSMIQATAPINNNPVRFPYRDLPTGRWTSEARFAAAAAARRIPRYIRVAHYDNEKWGATPRIEQRHPARYERAFCRVAHAHHLLCVTGPGRDLCPVAFPGSRGSLNHCYLRHDMAGAAARYADYIDIQAEANELHGTRVYGKFVRRAAAQARAANRHVIALGNLNATPHGRLLRAAQLNADARAVFGTGRNRVAGFYITITSRGRAATARFLRLFDRLHAGVGLR